MQDEVADRQHRHRVEAVMLIRHVGQPLDALVELIAQALVVECGQIDVGQRTVAQDRCRLELVVPTFQHVPPDPLLEGRCRDAGATADLGPELLGRFRAVRSRHVERDGLHVHEPVDVHHVHRVEQRAPPRQRLCEPAAHPRRIRRLRQRRHRRRQVRAVLHPGPRPRRIHSTVTSLMSTPLTFVADAVRPVAVASDQRDDGTTGADRSLKGRRSHLALPALGYDRTNVDRSSRCRRVSTTPRTATSAKTSTASRPDRVVRSPGQSHDRPEL